jgi:hypothetical protein
MQPTDSTVQSPPSADEPASEHEVAHEHVHLPPPSIWPMTTAAGVAIAGLGLVTFWPFSLAGVIIMAVGIIYWVQELRHEPHY